MNFDAIGLPKEMGASDLQDSSRLAGVMATFGHAQSPDLNKYLVDGKYVRHPLEKIYTMSRDQTICLFSGLAAQKQFSSVDAKYGTEGDLVSPSVRDHFKRCSGLKSHTFLGNLFLRADIIWQAKLYDPMAESNQLLCVLAHADLKFFKMWISMNKHWKAGIIEYWCGWRGEKELAELMIIKIERRMSTGLDFWI